MLAAHPLLEASSVVIFLTLCQTTPAGSVLLCRKKWILGKQAGLFCQTAIYGLSKVCLPIALKLDSCKVGTLSEVSFLKSKTYVNQRIAASARGVTWHSSHFG